jgi:uncharacterized SAM-binding protein YcdF (DUF218 family)
MALVKSLATPMVWVLLLLVAGLVLARLRGRRKLAQTGWWLLLLGTLTLAILSFPPFANSLIYSLECRFPARDREALSNLDVVVVLGGGGQPSGGFRAEADLAGRSYPRLYHGVRVFKEGEAEMLAFCGGELREGKERESDVMRAMAVHLGVQADKILTETDSASTLENARGLAALLPPKPPKRIALVTSAIHMPRSKRTFQRQLPQHTIVPVPVHYLYDPNPWRLKNLRPSVIALKRSTDALHEWIGMIWYAVRYR